MSISESDQLKRARATNHRLRARLKKSIHESSGVALSAALCLVELQRELAMAHALLEEAYGCIDPDVWPQLTERISAALHMDGTRCPCAGDTKRALDGEP